MKSFNYERAQSANGAVMATLAAPAAKYLGGGTNLVDLMREGIERPDRLVDVSDLNAGIKERADGNLLIGASTRNTAVAEHRIIRDRYPMLARAILSGASGQIRNMATVGGNLLQRTRCAYFYDDAARCNKRFPRTGCDAQGGFNRIHAILGASETCVATHPSDMCVALAALDGVVHMLGADGPRTLPLSAFHLLPGERPDLETALRPGELIVAVELPSLPRPLRSTYRKVRDRASYAFALISVAAGLDLSAGGRVRDVRIALGGVAHRPWRARKAEAFLIGHEITIERLRHAADLELADARPLRDNGFKIELARRTIIAVMEQLHLEMQL